jgi:site-specific DNA-methyltransferase (adenine-specific)
MTSLVAYPFTQAVLDARQRWSLVDEDCLSFLSKVPDCVIDSICTDPPAAISFMGREWDAFEDRGAFVGFLTERFLQCYRILKPGGHGLVWSLPRTSHWTAWALEDAGFEIRDCVYHIFGNGFAKGGTIDKTIRRKAPERLAEWEGWGTTLKPAAECWWLIRKPFKGTVAGNVLERGTGALNIDACRITTDEKLTRKLGKTTTSPSGWMSANRSPIAGKDGGRWPANLVFSHNDDCELLGHESVNGSEPSERWSCTPGCPIAELDCQSGPSKSRKGKPRKSKKPGDGWGMTKTGAEYNDEGGASRCVYCATPSRKEKEAGLAELPEEERHLRRGLQ